MRRAAAPCLLLVGIVMCTSGLAADVTFNISYIAESNPHPPIPNVPTGTGSAFSYADVWSEGGYAYLGSDRGRISPNAVSGHPEYANLARGRGMAVFSISNAGIPTFIPRDPGSPPAPTGFVDTTYIGNEMEDVEVYDGIGYFASDTNSLDATPRTGVDIVDLSIPFDPILLGRVDTSDCLAGNPGVCAHGKVHTISVQRINPNTPSEQRFLYTSDNDTSVVKITNVTNPSSPQLVTSLSLGLASNIDSHEVVVRNNRLYVASKNPDSNTTDGYFHIYDVSNPLSPVLLKGFLSGAATHTAMPTADGKTLIVAEERTNGNVKIYDISMIDQPNDPQNPVLLKTLNESTVCHPTQGCIDARSPHHVHVFGNLLFLPWYEAGLQVFNISNPANPKYVGAFDTFTGNNESFSGNWGVDLSMGLKRVLLSDRQRGLIVVDASGVVIPGDYNQDMIVDNADYDVWRAAFLTTTSNVHDAPLADGNYDGKVDAADYVIWRNNFGLTGPTVPGFSAIVAGATVPEPATMLLVIVGVGLAAAHRRRVRK